MAWQIAKMIVNDVVHQSNHDSPGKSTKVLNLTQWRVSFCGDVCLGYSPSLSVFCCLSVVMTLLRNQRTVTPCGRWPS